MIEVRKIRAFTHKIDRKFSRADLEFYSIDHFRPSYTTKIFFNDPKVDEANFSAERGSYAGEFTIFGHANCAGDVGHCQVADEFRRFDDRPSHPLTRAFKRVQVTEALRNAVEKRSTLAITLVSACDDSGEFGFDELLSMTGMQLVTFE